MNNTHEYETIVHFMRAVAAFELASKAKRTAERLTLTQALIFITIADKIEENNGEPVSITDIKDKIPSLCTNPSHTLRLLEDKDLIQGERDPFDKRCVLVSLTDKGKDAILAIRENLNTAAGTAYDSIPSDLKTAIDQSRQTRRPSTQ